MKRLDPTWWRRMPDGSYSQQDGRARLTRTTKPIGWALHVDSEHRGQWATLRVAKQRASELETP